LSCKKWLNDIEYIMAKGKDYNYYNHTAPKTCAVGKTAYGKPIADHAR